MGGMGSGRNQRGISRNAGIRNARAKLTPGKVVQVCARFASGESKAALAKAFGVSADSITKILDRRSWSDVPRVGDTLDWGGGRGRVVEASATGNLLVEIPGQLYIWHTPEELTVARNVS